MLATTKAMGRLASRSFATAAAGAEALPSFTRALFNGKLNSAAVYPFPDTLSAEKKEELQMAVDSVSAFLSANNDATKNDKTGSVPQSVVDGLKDLGAFGLQVPQELGGVGLSNAAYARAVEVVGQNTDLGLGILLGSHQSIGFKGLLLQGVVTKEQQEKYLPKLASGEWRAAFALTESGAGSDAAGIKTRAKLSADGKTWILNGSKIWISNGDKADFMTVFAKTEVLDEKTGEMKDKMTAFLVERAFGGVTSGALEDKMGIKASPTSEVYFENTPVPVENVLGKPGDGFKIAMEILNNGRFGMGAALSGLMKTIIGDTTTHLNTRVAFGKKLAEFGLPRASIATMTARLYATESLAYLLANNMDRGQKDYQLEAAASKILASDTAWYVADEALQLWGGLGFMKALPYERYVRDLRIFRIFEGSNPVLKLMIGLTGLQSAGKALEPLKRAMASPLANLPTLLPFAVDLLKTRAGIVDKPILGWVPTKVRPSAEVIENAAGEFGVVCRELLMKHGKKIVDKQQVVERVGEVAMDLTAGVAALSRAVTAYEKNQPGAAQELELAALFIEDAKARMAANLKFARGGGKRLVKLQDTVAGDVLSSGKYHAQHPVGF